jgi:CHAT domain-containing protein
MNWQGVQANGFLPTTFIAAYSPSYTSTSYNPSSTGTLPAYHPPALTLPPSFNVLTRANQNRVQPSTLAPKDSFDIVRPSATRPIDLDKIIKDRENALALHEAAGDKVASVVDHSDLARLFVQADKPEKALAHLGAIETMNETLADPKLWQDLLSIKGAAYLSSGEFEQSIAAYREAMRIQRILNDERAQAETFLRIGWAFQSLGNAPRALTCYESALYLFQKMENEDGEVRTRLGIGSLYQSMGEFSKALDQYVKATANSSDEQHARILVSTSEILQSRNQTSAALHGYEKALSLLQSGGDLTLEAAVLAGIGRCSMTFGAYREARYDFERARVRLKDAGNRAGEAGILASIAELNYWTALGSPSEDPKPHFSEALRGYSEALALMRSVGDRTGEVGVLTNIGLLYDAWGKSHDALSYYRQALQKMDELQTSARLEEFRISLADQSVRLYQRAVQLEINMHHIEEAFDLSERARARSLLDQLGNTRINVANHSSPNFSANETKLRRESILLQRQLGQELAKPGPQVSQGKIRSLQSRLSIVRKDYEDSIDELKLSNPEYASFLSISPITLRSAQQQLGPDVTLVSYFTTPEATLAFVLTSHSFHVSKLSVTEDQLGSAVSTLLDFASPSGPPPSLKSLYRWLIAPIKSHLKTSTLAVVPYGVLHDLPFAALTHDGNRYLGDDYAVFSLPSVSVLPYIRAHIKPAGNQALVMANSETEGFSRLGYAYEEARAVASLFGTQPLLGKAATSATLRTKAGDYDIVHLIAHIAPASVNSEFQHIVLGQGNGDDGPLELDQVFGLDLRKTSLVVLSGCRSQQGRRSRGDDITSLSRAFIYAGSPTVVASLWDVDDDATKNLMIAFYTRLQEGMSKVGALRGAQAEIRQKYPHPYYWAGFVLTGDPGATANSSLLAQSVK